MMPRVHLEVNVSKCFVIYQIHKAVGKNRKIIYLISQFDFMHDKIYMIDSRFVCFFFLANMCVLVCCN